MTLRLGIDLGGTSAKIALVSSQLKVIRETSVKTAGFPSPLLLAQQLKEAIQQMMKGKQAGQVGVGVAGDIDSQNGIIRLSPNLKWKNVPLKRILEKELRIPAVIENDAKVAAWGVYKTQVPATVQHLIVMTLGTGVGGGLILNGRLHRGATGSAGEVGHLNIDENGPLCNCGHRGCLETYVGGPHLVKRVQKALKAGQRSRLQKLYRDDPKSITPYAISLAAQAGDAYARSIWNDVGHALGIAVGDLIYLLNPQMILFTGGVAQAKNLILTPLKKTLNQRTFKTPLQAVQIKVAENASHVGVVGASLLV